MNYNFEIGKSFAGIDFTFPVEKVIKILGKPDSKYNDDISMYLEYEKSGLLISYEKENKKWIDLGIQTNKLFYEGKNWNNYNKKDLIKIIKKIYKKRDYIFDFDFTKLEGIEEEQYNFHEIGVALFFHNDKLKSVDVSKPII